MTGKWGKRHPLASWQLSLEERPSGILGENKFWCIMSLRNLSDYQRSNFVNFDKIKHAGCVSINKITASTSYQAVTAQSQPCWYVANMISHKHRYCRARSTVQCTWRVAVYLKSVPNSWPVRQWVLKIDQHLMKLWQKVYWLYHPVEAICNKNRENMLIRIAIKKINWFTQYSICDTITDHETVGRQEYLREQYNAKTKSDRQYLKISEQFTTNNP